MVVLLNQMALATLFVLLELGEGGLVGGFLGWFVLVWVLLVWFWLVLVWFWLVLVWLCFVLVWLFLSSRGLVWHRWHIGYGAIRWWCDEVWMNGQHWGISW